MSECHLFIIWEKARYQQDKILDDISKHFKILKCYEVTWSKDLVSSNFTRFYGVKLPNHSVKEEECGIGEFLLVVVSDLNPVYDYRMTSHGEEWVNINMFDAKQLYREWTNGGHKIHCSNTTAEFIHDATLLLGDAFDLSRLSDEHDEWDGTFVKINRNIIGATGWKSIRELFDVLNATVRYVLLRGYEGLLSGVFTGAHRDIDLLVDDVDSVKYIINGTLIPDCVRPHIVVPINGDDYILDLWQYQWRYFDERWALKMLNQRILKSGYYVLDSDNNIYALLYHCLVVKGNIAKEYEGAFSMISGDLNQYLVDFLAANGYEIPVVLDPSVSFHFDNSIIDKYAHRFGENIKQLIGVVGDDDYCSYVFEKKDSFVKLGTNWLIQNEVEILQRLCKLNQIPHIIANGSENEKYWVEISRVDGISADRFWNDKNRNTGRNVLNFIGQLWGIIKQFQAHNILHRDLRPENVLVSCYGTNMTVGLIDFGWAIDFDNLSQCKCPTELGAQYKMPNGFSDVYSIGVFLKEKWNTVPTIYALANYMMSDPNDVDGIEHLMEKKLTCRDQLQLFKLRHRTIAKYLHVISVKRKNVFKILRCRK